MKYEGTIQYGVFRIAEDLQDYLIERYNEAINPQKIYNSFVKVKTLIKFLKRLDKEPQIVKTKPHIYSVPVEIAYILTGKKPEKLKGKLKGEPFSIFPTHKTLLMRELLLGTLVPFASVAWYTKERISNLVNVFKRKIDDILQHAIYDTSFDVTFTENLLKIKIDVRGEKQSLQKKKPYKILIPSLTK